MKGTFTSGQTAGKDGVRTDHCLGFEFGMGPWTKRVWERGLETIEGHIHFDERTGDTFVWIIDDTLCNTSPGSLLASFLSIKHYYSVRIRS